MMICKLRLMQSGKQTEYRRTGSGHRRSACPKSQQRFLDGKNSFLLRLSENGFKHIENARSNAGRVACFDGIEHARRVGAVGDLRHVGTAEQHRR